MGNNNSALSNILTDDIFESTLSEDNKRTIYYIKTDKYNKVLDDLIDFYTKMATYNKCIPNIMSGEKILNISLIKQHLNKYNKKMTDKDFTYLAKQKKYTIKSLYHDLYIVLTPQCEKLNNKFGRNEIKGGKKSKSKKTKSKSKKSKSKKSKSKKSKSKKSKKY